MVTQNRQPQKGINPGNKGPAQPQDVEDPHPADEESIADEGRAENGAHDDNAKGGKRPSDTSDDRRRSS
ncbi:MAG TPA: hypothetical protein VGN80_01395 [Devosiaceae bacterium]|nr:hypothetical protein [Devosiaceae bacterium]